MSGERVSVALNLLKLAVGIDDIDQLRQIREARAAERGGNWVYTRNYSRRAPEVLAGGSIYCVIDVDAKRVATLSRTWRPFQGWRYLLAEDAPPDRSAPAQLPPDRMLADLRALGLI